MRSWILAICAVFVLGACSTESVWAPDVAVTKATYRHAGPTKLTLLTMFKNETDQGAHTSLMISGSQRVIFDPSGSFKNELAPERNDVLFGITPQMEERYIAYHTREDFRSRLEVQEINVSPEVAEMAIRAVMAYGPAPFAHCARSTSNVISSLPGFGQIESTLLPKNLFKQFEKVSGVTAKTINPKE